MEKIYLYGWHVFEEILKNNSRTIFKIMILPQNEEKLEKLINKYSKFFFTVQIVSQAVLNKVSQDTQGIVVVASGLKTYNVKSWLSQIDLQKKNLLIACDCIQDSRNLGAIMRTTRAFNCSIMITTNNSCSVNAACVKSSAGATESLKIIETNNLNTSLIELKKAGFFVYALDQNGSTNWKMPSLSVLVLGQEGKGLRELTKKTCDNIIKIETDYEFQVLNVSVAAGIAIHKILN